MAVPKTMTAAANILVVDDDADIRVNACDLLEDRGFRVDVAADGKSALQLVRQNHYDVALLDFQMPDMNGAELYDQIRELQPGTVAAIITGYAGSDRIQRGKAAGEWHVLSKPVDFEHVFRFIQNALGKPGQ